jgi:hypothetical protein
VRSTALGAFERTHGRTHAQLALAVIYVQTQGNCGRTHAQSALATIAVICSRTCILRSTTNSWCVQMQVVRSNASSAFKRSPVTRQPINRPRCIICFSRLGGASRAQKPSIFHCKSLLSCRLFNLCFILLLFSLLFLSL